MKEKDFEKHTRTNAPKNIELTVQTDRKSRLINDVFPSNSIDEHKNIEIANEFIAEEEIKQQKDNL